MASRKEVIANAIEAIESGQVTPPVGQDPTATADSLRERSEAGGFAGFAAFKDAQRIVGGGA